VNGSDFMAPFKIGTDCWQATERLVLSQMLILLSGKGNADSIKLAMAIFATHYL
jgi:hypothetical protein